MTEKSINVTWKDIHSEEIIFIDRMQIKEFKQIHGVSPHTCSECGYHDVIVKI